MTVVKDLKKGVAGDALFCACDAGDRLSDDSERDRIVWKGGEDFLSCSW